MTLLAMGVWFAVAGRGHADTTASGPLPTFAFLARADDPVDALAAASAAGQLGAPVLLTYPDALAPAARNALVEAAPDVVVIAGGTAALSPAVETGVRRALPAADVRRVGGETRIDTAAALGRLTVEHNVGRPLVTGARIAGDVAIDGSLIVNGMAVGGAMTALDESLEDLAARLDAVVSENGELAAALRSAVDRIGTLESELADANGRVDALESTLSGVTHDGDTLVFSGMNVRIDNGAGGTDTINGLGNLVIGYAEDASVADRSGSHNLVVGSNHTYSSYGGLVAGIGNAVTAPYASVTGGSGNTASGYNAAVLGGWLNIATDNHAVAAGGWANEASAPMAFVAGGLRNSAQAQDATIVGGGSNEITQVGGTVAGGFDNSVVGDPTAASPAGASIFGGQGSTTDGDTTTVVGGTQGTLSDAYDTLVGNQVFPDEPVP